MSSTTATWPALQRWVNQRWGSTLWPLLVLLMGLLALVFRGWGEVRSWQQVDAVDVIGEGGMVAMAGLWLHLIASGRPAGRVSNWLVLGMAGLGLGFWVDLLDEFYRLPKAMLWDNALESMLMLGGMLAFTRGLWLWREEQQALSLRLLKRERLFRDHRGYDTVTQLADASYLARQIDLERAAQPGDDLALLMLALPGHAQRSRELGLVEGERALQAVSLLLLLNLPPDSLLCRYAADRYGMLLPRHDAAQAQTRAEQLCAAVADLQHHRMDGQPLALHAHCVHLQVPSGTTTLEAEQLLRQLQQRVAAAQA